MPAKQHLVKAMAEFYVVVIYAPSFVFSTCYCGSYWLKEYEHMYVLILYVVNILHMHPVRFFYS